MYYWLLCKYISLWYLIIDFHLHLQILALKGVSSAFSVNSVEDVVDRLTWHWKMVLHHGKTLKNDGLSIRTGVFEGGFSLKHMGVDKWWLNHDFITNRDFNQIGKSNVDIPTIDVLNIHSTCSYFSTKASWYPGRVRRCQTWVGLVGIRVWGSFLTSSGIRQSPKSLHVKRSNASLAGISPRGPCSQPLPSGKPTIWSGKSPILIGLNVTCSRAMLVLLVDRRVVFSMLVCETFFLHSWINS